MSRLVAHLVQELTHGRPFVFVIMAYKEKWMLYREIKRIVEAETNLLCIRADDALAAGHDLLEKIHLLIDRAELVVAEVGTESKNVFYEVGYAVGQQKPLLLLAQSGTQMPTDLKGRELIEYTDDRIGSGQFESQLRAHLRSRLGSRLALLRDMLLGDVPTPAYIVASPRYPGKETRIPGQRYDRRTFGDNLGIRGLLEAFGLLIGEGSGVELVSAQYTLPQLLEQPYNLYLIGSKKTNPCAGRALEEVQRGSDLQWYLGRIPRDPKTGRPRGDASDEERRAEEAGDYICGLYRLAKGHCEKLLGTTEEALDVGGVVHTTDYGLVVRTPHPYSPGRIIVVLAGAHSLGTGAACLAATRSQKIREIRDRLGIDFSDKSARFWALVEGRAGADGLLDESGVSIREVGVYR